MKHGKKKDETTLIGAGFMASFVMRFCLTVILGSFFIGVILYLLYRRDIGETYLTAISTIVSLKGILVPALIFTILLQLVILSIIIIFLTLFVSHKIAGPIYRLERVLKEIGKGDLTLREIGLRTRDQIQSLADSFAGMSKGLAERARGVRVSMPELEKKRKKLCKLFENKEYQQDELINALKDLRNAADKVGKEVHRVKTGKG